MRIGDLSIGAGHPVAVQSMAATRTQDVKATLRQVRLLEAAGADVIRIAVDSRKDTEALAEIAESAARPLSVDLQENYRLAEVVAPHVQKIRYNPGHLYHHERRRPERGKQVPAALMMPGAPSETAGSGSPRPRSRKS